MSILETHSQKDSLQHSEDLFRLMVENLKDYALFTTNAEGRIASWNTGAERLFGYAEAEIIGQPFAIIFTPEDIKSDVPGQELSTAAVKGCAEDKRWQMRRDGTRFWASGMVLPLSDDDGNLSGFVKVARDQTEHVLAEQHLHESHRKISSILESITDAFYTLDRNWCFTHINSEAEHLLGRPGSSLIGKNIWEEYPAEVDTDRYREYQRAVAEGVTVTTEFHHSSSDNWYTVRAYPSSEGLFVYSHNVTERRRAEATLRRESTLMQALLDHIPDAIYFKDVGSRFVRVGRHTHLRGITSPEQAIGKTDFDFFTEEHAREAYEDEQQIISTGQPMVDKVEKETFPDGTEGWVLTTKVPIFDATGQTMGIVGVSHDITERKHAEEAQWRAHAELELRVEERTAELSEVNASLVSEIARRQGVEQKLVHEAYHDSLTDLPNRAMFIDHLRRALGRLHRHDNYLFAVLFLDLDRFKVVNDSLGHIVGDQLLVAAARKLATAVRPEDIVARLGGDEFTILLDNIHDVSDAIHVVERIHKDLQTTFHLNGHEIHTTASIGIALSSIRYNQPEELLSDADTAMYRAKTQGRARYEIFDPSMHARAVALSKLETDLRRAVEHQEFLIHYQPIVSLQTKEINGFEALVRWQQPERGLVPAAEFIPWRRRPA